LFEALAIITCFCSSGQQGAFGGVTDRFPRSILFDETGVIAAKKNGREFA